MFLEENLFAWFIISLPHVPVVILNFDGYLSFIGSNQLFALYSMASLFIAFEHLVKFKPPAQLVLNFLFFCRKTLKTFGLNAHGKRIWSMQKLSAIRWFRLLYIWCFRQLFLFVLKRIELDWKSEVKLQTAVRILDILLILLFRCSLILYLFIYFGCQLTPTISACSCFTVFPFTRLHSLIYECGVTQFSRKGHSSSWNVIFSSLVTISNFVIIQGIMVILLLCDLIL